ncbi:hypothetical protein FLK61_30680 [Paenalkalicoccus suaedae]|uniref:ABC transporter periplasmic binding protein yphF n=2 Tax=Paenalkalicoccus suaedae TaxID=2592382 RepID=A0A859FK96_9BACI|nr:hypothetical protein FLK61_30680 [Paenalkalicoccus suaedae]
MLLGIVAALLSGCLYPQEERTRNQVPYEDQLVAVGNAVNQYRENNSGLLPIATREADTPLYRKYPIQFTQLVPMYMQEAPSNSFENGGTFQYVLVDVEEEPQVKLIDLKTIRTIQEVESAIFQYRSQNDYAPVAEVIGTEILKLDYEALGFQEEPTVDSPFHPTHQLPLVLTTRGDVVIDYGLDIRFYVDEYGIGDFQEGDDLRDLLVEHAPFVPTYSLPQSIENGEIIFLEEGEIG